VSGMAIYLIGCPPPAASKTLVDLIAMRYKPCHVSPMRWPQPTAVTCTLLNINLYIKSTPTPTGLIPIPYHTLPLPRSLVTTQRLDTPSFLKSPPRSHLISFLNSSCLSRIHLSSLRSISICPFWLLFSGILQASYLSFLISGASAPSSLHYFRLKSPARITHISDIGASSRSWTEDLVIDARHLLY
jgi:hypothetical protein